MPLLRRSRRHGYCSTAGRRAVNEDRAVTLAIGRDRYVALVADGMGGARAGDIASDSAMKAFVRSVRAMNHRNGEEVLREGFAAADEAIRAASSPQREGMGSTLVAAITHHDEIWIGNIGDSRAVLVTADEILPLSTEHNVVGEAFRKGEITELEALRHPERHVVLRALGEGDSRPDMKFHSFQTVSVRSRAVVLLGSDGLFNFIGDTEILELSEQFRTAGQVTERVVRRAIDNGSDDNVSAAALVVHSRRSGWWG